jgi:hypothetical protein
MAIHTHYLEIWCHRIIFLSYHSTQSWVGIMHLYMVMSSKVTRMKCKEVTRMKCKRRFRIMICRFSNQRR